MLLSIIIVSYNTADLTQKTLESVWAEVKRSPILQGESEVLVVDNLSTDNSVAVIETLFKSLKSENSKILSTKLIKNDRNAGFATANNLGIHASTGEYVLLLNSDTLVQPHAIEKLVRTFEQHPVRDLTATVASHAGVLDRLGILSAQLLNPDKTIQTQGGSLPSLLALGSHMLMFDDLPIVGKLLPSTQHTGLRSDLIDQTGDSLLQKVIQIDWVGGTAMMIRRELFNEIGLLDQNIFMYGEDIEFCWRAKSHQWDIGICPQAKIIHYGSASSTSANAIIGEFKGYLYIWSKHQPIWQMRWAKKILKMGAQLRKFLFGTILKQKERAKIYTIILSEVF